LTKRSWVRIFLGFFSVTLTHSQNITSNSLVCSFITLIIGKRKTNIVCSLAPLWEKRFVIIWVFLILPDVNRHLYCDFTHKYSRYSVISTVNRNLTWQIIDVSSYFLFKFVLKNKNSISSISNVYKFQFQSQSYKYK
jgi:hypothetical protein